MKKWCIVGLIFFLAAVTFGCEAQEKQQGGEFRESESITAAADAGDYNKLLKELQREIGVLVGDAQPIGPDHYKKLSERLKQLSGKGLPEKELDELERELEALNPEWQKETGGQPSGEGHGEQGELEMLKREIGALAQTARPTGADNYRRLDQQLRKLEAAGADVGDLRVKLEIVKPLGKLPVNETGKFREFDRSTLPDCDGKLFTFAPVDLDEVYAIGGLGGIGPPGHTFPTEHTYWHISATGETTRMVDLYAPGDAYITEVVSTPEPEITDYTIRFALCKDIHGYYNHAKAISEGLKAVLDGIECEKWESIGNSCTKRLNNYTVKAGTVIGKVGHIQGNFDVGALDYRITNKFANPARYKGRTPNIVCPFEYFTPEIKSRIYAKVKRTAEPRCGEVMQDMAGTLQGNWFYGSNATAETEWERQLAFVHDAGDPRKAVISIAGIISGPMKWTFTPANQGIINREFSQVKSDGKVYCYNLASGKIVLKMTSATELQIEKQSRSCTGSEQLKPNSTAYGR